MRIFNEEHEGNNKKQECIILAEWSDLRLLCQIVDSAVAANPKKKSWKRIQQELELLAIY